MDASFHYDLTRPGVSLYGGSPFAVDEPQVKSVVSLKAPIVQVRRLNPGDSVGYNATFTATKPTTIATVSIGYGDGLPVGGSNRAFAIISGEQAPIAGRVSMDLICLDVSNLAAPAQTGDAAEFYGAGIRLFEAARAFGVNSYELLTGLGGRVDRRYL
jgi:alanine racemase